MVTNNSINLQQEGVAYYDGAGTFTGVDGNTVNYVLTSNGANVAPAFKAVSSSGAVTSMPTDDGTGTPTAGALSLLGATATDYVQSGMVTHASVGHPSQVYIENRLYQTKFVVDPSATIGQRGTYQTITAAYAAATAGTVIFVRPGTYTENFTPVAGTILTASNSLAGSNGVTIVGKVSLTGAGTYEFSNINFQTNLDFAISCTGASAVVAQFNNCGFTGQNNTILQFSNSNASSKIDFWFCNMDLKTTGIAYFSDSSPGTLAFSYSITSNSGGSTTASTKSDGFLTANYSAFLAPITISGTNARISCDYDLFNCAAQNTTPLNYNSTIGINNSGVNQSSFTGGSSPCFTIGAGATLTVSNTTLYTSNASLCTGAGTLVYTGLTSTGNNSAILNVSTLTPYTLLPYAQSAAAAAGSVRGTASFDSAVFSVSSGFVSLSGSGGVVWSDQGSSTTVSSGHGYFVTATCALTLPASPSNGDTIRFFVDGAFTLTITANTGQKIKVATALSSAAGTAANTSSGDAMTLVYRSTNTQWEAINYVGAWNLA